MTGHRDILRILAQVLRHGACDRAALDAAVALPPATQTRLLNRLVDEGLLSRLAHGRYGPGPHLPRLGAVEGLAGAQVAVVARWQGMLGEGFGEAVAAVLAAAGLQAPQYHIGSSDEPLAEALQRLCGDGLRGAVVFQHLPIDAPSLARLRERGVAVVQAGYPGAAAVDTVSWDEQNGLFGLADTLVAQGADALLYLDLANYPNQPLFRRRMRMGVAAAASERGVPLAFHRIDAAAWQSPAAIAEVLGHLAELRRGRRLGIIAIQNVQVASLVALLDREGIVLGSDVLLGGVLSAAFVAGQPYFANRLTARLVPPVAAVGALAAWRLVQRLRGDAAPPACSLAGVDDDPSARPA